MKSCNNVIGQCPINTNNVNYGSIDANNVKYGYFTVPYSPSKKGIITVAITRPNKDDPNQRHVAAFSFCSPKDVFTKVWGRRIAENRLGLVDERRREAQLVEINYRGPVSEVINSALDKAVKENKVPTWVKRAYQKENVYYGLNVNPW